MRFTYRKFFFLGSLFLFCYFEFLSYWILPLTWWQPLDCQAPDCKTLFLLADPQIIGPEWNYLTFMDWIAIFDSDRYMRRTFSKAYNYIQPDIIVFLGDLMDQGYKASENEYLSYLNRLKYMFDIRSPVENSTMILIPGDNDIGGIDEILVPSSVLRFDKTFNQNKSSTLFDFIEFCKVNLMTSQLQKSKFNDKGVIRIALSHVPLLPKKYYYVNEVVKYIMPHLILSGHSHRSRHLVTYEKNTWKTDRKSISPQNPEMTLINIKDGEIHEIDVPTCSYRMGVTNMGYGVAYIDIKKMTIQYNVLWLPHRFFQLFMYLGLLSNILLIECVRIFMRIRRCSLQREFKFLVTAKV